MVMFRGRGGRGGGRGRVPPPHLMHGVPPMRMKPGRGMPPRGPPAAGRGGPPPPPRPLMPRSAYDGPPRHLMPRPRLAPPGPPGPPFAPGRRLRAPRPPLGPGPPGPYGRPAPPDMMRPPMGVPLPGPYPPRGAGGPPFRGRGGRGGRGAARGAKSAAAPRDPQPKAAKVVKKTSRTEKERDANDLLKPWVTPELREEIQKKHEMHSASRKTGDPEDFEAFKQQRNKVSAMLRAAKLEYIGMHEEEDVGKIMAEVGLIQATKVSESTAAANTKTKPKAAENGAGSETPEPTEVKAEQGHSGSVIEQPADGAGNGDKA